MATKQRKSANYLQTKVQAKIKKTNHAQFRRQKSSQGGRKRGEGTSEQIHPSCRCGVVEMVLIGEFLLSHSSPCLCANSALFICTEKASSSIAAFI